MLTILKIMQLLQLDQDEDIKVRSYYSVVSVDFYEKKKVSLFISLSKVAMANIVMAAPLLKSDYLLVVHVVASIL